MPITAQAAGIPAEPAARLHLSGASRAVGNLARLRNSPHAIRDPLTILDETPQNPAYCAGMPVAFPSGNSNASHSSEVDMDRGIIVRWSIGAAFAVVAGVTPHAIAAAGAPLAIDTARVTLAGTSNVHEYSASTTQVRVTRAQLGSVVAGPEFWDSVLKPGAVEAFEIAIPAATLTSPREGLDKNMHKALKVAQHPDITFHLLRIEAGQTGALKGIGLLRIAGVEREVTLNLKTQRKESTLTVTGTLDLLMTDYGITPPKAMLGMLKTDPKVTITFETVLSVPLT
jgi:polyisoprenoid-binding protein YceI